MQRTQIYLTSDQKARLEAIAGSRSVSMADVIRDAVSQYLAGSGNEHRLNVLRDTFGAVAEWKCHDGVELARQMRSQWSRPPKDSQDKSPEGDVQP